MRLRNTFNIALKAITAHKVRSFLTTLGVIIGVSSVVLLISIGQGLKLYVIQQFENLGANTIIISPGDVFGDEGSLNLEEQIEAVGQDILTFDQLREVEQLKPNIELATPITNNNDEISFQQNNKFTIVVGTTPEYQQLRNLELDRGRFFSEPETKSKEKVAVLGHDLAEELFGQIDPIGKKIQVGKQNYRVVGLAEKIGSSFGGPDFDNYVYIPVERALSQYDRNDFSQIIVKVPNQEQIEPTIKLIEEKLSQDLDEDEFSVFDQREILNVIDEILSFLTIGLSAIGAISLLVGGVGIMNIMLVSVAERTNEIGLRKALGATPDQILLQFLIEASLLSLLGGIIGLIVAFLGSLAIQLVFPAKITWQAVALAFGVSVGVGLIFGATPARRAAKLSPIETLRYE